MNNGQVTQEIAHSSERDGVEDGGSADVLFLGISGVLHPSRSMYLLVRGSSPSSDGHRDYEGVPVLERALLPYASVRIVLTSTQPWKHGLAAVKAQLGPGLAERVDGFAFDMLANRGEMSVDTYWRLDKSAIVAACVQRQRPRAWVVVDDENIRWPTAVRDSQLVLTDARKGLLDSTTEDRLQTVLAVNFRNGANEAAASNLKCNTTACKVVA